MSRRIQLAGDVMNDDGSVDVMRASTDTAVCGVETGTAGTPRQVLYRTLPDDVDSDNDGLRDDEEATNNVKVACGSQHMSSSSTGGLDFGDVFGPEPGTDDNPVVGNAGTPLSEPVGVLSLVDAVSNGDILAGLVPGQLYEDPTGLLFGLDAEGLFAQGGYAVRYYLKMNEPVDCCGSGKYKLDLVFDPIRLDLPLISADEDEAHFKLKTVELKNIPTKNWYSLTDISISGTAHSPPGASVDDSDGVLRYDIPDDTSKVNLDNLEVKFTIRGEDKDAFGAHNNLDFNPNHGEANVVQTMQLDGETAKQLGDSEYLLYGIDEQYTGSKLSGDGDEDGTIQVRYGDTVPTYFTATLKQIRNSDAALAGPPNGVCFGVQESTC